MSRMHINEAATLEAYYKVFVFCNPEAFNE